MSEDCGICGLDIDDKFPYTLDCGHKFHYECLLKTFSNISYTVNGKYNMQCPYCRKKSSYLPLVNGLKKINICIHDTSNVSEFENIKCKTIMKSGKRKNEQCGANCKLGYFQCSRHFKP